MGRWSYRIRTCKKVERRGGKKWNEEQKQIN